jgi:hypothetical protein
LTWSGRPVAVQNVDGGGGVFVFFGIIIVFCIVIGARKLPMLWMLVETRSFHDDFR